MFDPYLGHLDQTRMIHPICNSLLPGAGVRKEPGLTLGRGDTSRCDMKQEMEKRFWAKVDKNGPNGCWVWTASRYSSGYGAFGTENHKVQAAHRFAYLSIKGEIPEGMELDHVCHNRACVNPDHLRICTHAENARNTGLKVGNKSGYKGVSWHRGAKKWRATIFLNYKQVHLGFFVTPESAHLAYCEAATRIHGDFANVGETA